MEKSDIEQRLHLLEKQVDAAVSTCQKTKLDLLSAIDSLKIEVETLRRFLEHQNPELRNSFSGLKEEVMEKVNPEWEQK